MTAAQRVVSMGVGLMPVLGLVLHPEGAKHLRAGIEAARERAWEIEVDRVRRRNLMLGETVMCLWGGQ